jgi:hypothetical protein
MFVHVVDAKYVSEYTIWVKFDIGDEGEVDLTDLLWGEIFEPLKEKDRFKKFIVDHEAGTIVWENGADIAPESLYRRVTAPDNRLRADPAQAPSR